MVALMRIVLLLVLACVGCTSKHELTACRGSFAAANPGKWTPAPGELLARGNR
jgi:hypothetical protein